MWAVSHSSLARHASSSLVPSAAFHLPSAGCVFITAGNAQMGIVNAKDVWKCVLFIKSPMYRKKSFDARTFFLEICLRNILQNCNDTAFVAFTGHMLCHVMQETLLNVEQQVWT